MKFEDLKINQLVYIEIDNSDVSRTRLPSRIEELYDDFLLLSMPMIQGRLVPLPVGQEVRIIVATKMGFYGGTSVVMGHGHDPIPVLVMEKPRQMDSLEQRREYVRLELNLPVYFTLHREGLVLDDEEYFQGISSDISAGGIFLLTRMPLSPGQLIKLRFSLGEGADIDCQGQVVRSIKDSLGGKKYGAGIKFVSIKDSQREKIFRFVFGKQREWIKKGLL